jgi:hypothetical protein
MRSMEKSVFAMVGPAATASRVNDTPLPREQGRVGMAIAVIATNLSRPAIREPGNHSRFADPRLISGFEAVATAAALSFDKASSNRRDERRSAMTRLDAQPPRILCGLLNSVVGDMTPTYGPRGNIQPQNRDLRLNRDFAALHLDKQPMRAPLERIPVRLLEDGWFGAAGAAHGYPD